ncbi:MAG: hypothetical protein DRP76_04450, partial [Candidatus Omnitrophota bacterium]
PYQVRKFFRGCLRIRKIKKELSRYKEDIENKTSLFKEKEKLRREIMEEESRIASLNDTSALSAYISEEAKKTAVEILKITLQDEQLIKETPTANYFYLPLVIEAEADFHNLALFFNRLHKGMYLLETKEVIIQSRWPNHKIKMVVCGIVKE